LGTTKTPRAVPPRAGAATGVGWGATGGVVAEGGEGGVFNVEAGENGLHGVPQHLRNSILGVFMVVAILGRDCDSLVPKDIVI
jgi:hypothetical protein